jgi:hypothetical protein
MMLSRQENLLVKIMSMIVLFMGSAYALNRTLNVSTHESHATTPELPHSTSILAEDPWTRADYIGLSGTAATLFALIVGLLISIKCIKDSRSRARAGVLERMQATVFMKELRRTTNFDQQDTRHQLGLFAELANRCHVEIQKTRGANSLARMPDNIAMAAAEYLGPRIQNTFNDRDTPECLRYAYAFQTMMRLRWWLPIPQQIIVDLVAGIPENEPNIQPDIELGGGAQNARGLPVLTGDQASPIRHSPIVSHQLENAREIEGNPQPEESNRVDAQPEEVGSTEDSEAADGATTPLHNNRSKMRLRSTPDSSPDQKNSSQSDEHTEGHHLEDHDSPKVKSQ